MVYVEIYILIDTYSLIYQQLLLYTKLYIKKHYIFLLHDDDL